MKIALYSTTIFPSTPELDQYGGLEKVVGLLAKYYDDLGHNVSLFGPMGSYVPKNGTLYASGQPGQFNEYDAWDNYWAVDASRNALKEADIVHDHSWMYCPYLKAKELKALCHTHHGPDPGFQVKPLVDKPNLIAVSPNHAKKLMQYQWQNPDGTLQPPMDCVWRGVNNGINLDLYPFQKEKKDYFLWIGRLFPFKGPHRFIDICDKMQQKGFIAGGSFGQDPGYVALIKQKLAASKYVTCEGEPGVSIPTKKIIELYMGAKAVVQPSIEYLPLSNGKGYARFIEPYGLIIAEANACGTPVVVTPSGGWQSTLRHGVNGFFANSDEEFIYYLRRINEIKAEDCRAVAEMFSYKVMGEEYLKMYNEVIQGGW